MGLVKTSFLTLKINTLCSPESQPRADTHTQTSHTLTALEFWRVPRGGLSFLVGVTNGSQKASFSSKYSVIKASETMPIGGTPDGAPASKTRRNSGRPRPPVWPGARDDPQRSRFLASHSRPSSHSPSNLFLPRW